MSEEPDHRLDERLRGALHDLDRRVATRIEETADSRRLQDGGNGAAGRTRPDRGPAGRGARPSRRLVPALVGFAVLALLVTVGWLARPTNPAHPITGPTPAVTPVNRAAQSPADAARDHVNPVLAKLPVSRRVLFTNALNPGTTTQVTAPEGTWVISRPDLSTFDDADSLCPTRESGEAGSLDVCSDYSEILLMSPDLQRIIRAFPMLALPPQWLILTPDAVYCGRQGDGVLVDSMVCRIDRTTNQLTGRVFPPSQTSNPHVPYTFEGWPGRWSNTTQGSKFGFEAAKLEAGSLRISSAEGTPTISLDPTTLEPQTD